MIANEYAEKCKDCVYREECGEPHYTTILRCPRYKTMPKTLNNDNAPQGIDGTISLESDE